MKEEIIAVYDISDIGEGQAEYLMENWQDHFDEKPTKAEVDERAYGDSDLYQMAWEDVISDITTAMRKMGDSSYWVAEGRQLGWQRRSGEAYVKADNGTELLQKILPKTDLNLKVWWGPRKKSMEFRVAHHDAPTGEFYTVRPATRKEIDDGNFD